MIPKRIVRSVPTDTSLEVEAFWAKACKLHPAWEHVTYRDPIDPDLFPLTSRYWEHCTSGAQKAGLVRLEALIHGGGVWVDSDLELFKPLDPLLDPPFWATWEDHQTVPDFVFGAEADHPILHELLALAVKELKNGPWASGPGVFTSLLPKSSVLLLPPQCFAPVHYTQRDLLAGYKRQPFNFGMHHWHGSWLA